MSDQNKFPADYAFGVCRIEPENNLHIILAAFEEKLPFDLVIVGNFDNSEYGRNLRRQYQLSPQIHLLDPIYEIDKLNTLRGNCRLYLHGHSCGGTNPSLVEAMYLGLPVAAFDVNFNRHTTENKAFYFASSQELRDICLAAEPESLAEVAAAMREIALRRYTWERISRCYAELMKPKR